MWVFDDAAADVASSELHSEHAAPSREHLQQQGQAVLASADKISTGSSGSPYAVHESEADGASPLSVLESVLAEASHDPEGFLPDDWLQSQEAEALEEALGMMASDETASAWPSSSEEPKGTAMGHSSLRAATSGGRMDAEALPMPEQPQSDSSREKIEASHGALRMPSTEPPVTPSDGLATSALESSVLRNILLSKSDDSTTLSSSEITDEALAETDGQAAQAHTATLYLLASFPSLPQLLMGVSDELIVTHPFYRHPEMQLRLSTRTFSLDTASCFRTRRQDVVMLLADCKHLLKKPWLNTKEFDLLMEYAERLCGYASGRMPVASTVKTPVGGLGRMFIVLDTLYCAAEALGQSSRKKEWWPMVANHIKGAGYHRKSNDVIRGKRTWSYPILSALRAALSYYRMGQRPPPRLVVNLKLALFLSPSPVFQKSVWDPWRQDAEEWLESIKATIQKNKQSTDGSTGRRL
ncbi:hypothetical protein EBH_0002850 [Eimeria brunetti]|uniref:Uncharacterized protein n=1 Tax=Eimeria brunetti TaxID=51314 RepID=U6LU57_9EIME|nr:hypothetical protein EBH_0002850 [Eimeria brunetti]